jgi:hypothetical protein
MPLTNVKVIDSAKALAAARPQRAPSPTGQSAHVARVGS